MPELFARPVDEPSGAAGRRLRAVAAAHFWHGVTGLDLANGLRDVFADAATLRDRIGHDLDKPALRRAFIERAYARCVPAYSIHSRAAVLDGLVGSRLAERER